MLNLSQSDFLGRGKFQSLCTNRSKQYSHQRMADDEHVSSESAFETKALCSPLQPRLSGINSMVQTAESVLLMVLGHCSLTSIIWLWAASLNIIWTLRHQTLRLWRLWLVTKKWPGWDHQGFSATLGLHIKNKLILLRWKTWCMENLWLKVNLLVSTYVCHVVITSNLTFTTFQLSQRQYCFEYAQGSYPGQ